MSLLAWIPGLPAWRRRRDMAICARTGARIQEIVDGEMPRGRAESVLLAHLAACQRCGAEAETIRELKRAIYRVSVRRSEAATRRLTEAVQGFTGDAG